MDQESMLLIHKWPLYAGHLNIYRFNNMESISLETCKMWSLKASGLNIQVVFRIGFIVRAQ